MPEAGRPLEALNRLVAKARCWIDVDAEFALADGRRLVVKLHNLSDTADTKASQLGVTVYDGGGARTRGPVWVRHRTLSATIRAFAREFTGAGLPPSSLRVRCAGSPLSTPAVKKLLLAGLAEAFGQEPPPKPGSAAKPAKTGPADWPSVLKTGAAGVRSWNRMKAGERKAVDLSRADLGGLDLSGANFAGVQAKKASFAGSTLAKANLAQSRIDGADFSTADLRKARLTAAGATEAIFRGAKLAGANLGAAMLFGCSFDGADLNGADLSDANLHRADLAGATLDGAIFEGASFDGLTAWPPGFTIPAEVIFAGRGTDPRLVGKGKSAVAVDINGLMARLQQLIDPRRVRRTIDMLKSGKNQLFAEVEPTLVRGIVRSQREKDLVYSCVLIDDGTYACCTPDLSICLGLRGEPCKHILVLLIGLARAGRLDPATVDGWVVAACAKKNHRWNKTTKNHVSDTLLRYKGVQAGEVDWRPTETIPEDFYAM
jgi:hypothetical protein